MGGGAGDAHVGEGAGHDRVGGGEVHELVLAGAPGEDITVLAARSLDDQSILFIEQILFDLPDCFGVKRMYPGWTSALPSSFTEMSLGPIR